MLTTFIYRLTFIKAFTYASHLNNKNITTPECDSNRFERPVVIGHRGGAGHEYRQSSYKGYENVVQNNAADYLECDLTITADNVLICSHEPEISAATDISVLDEGIKGSLLSTDRMIEEELDPFIDWRSVPSEDYSTKEPYLIENVRRSTSWFLTDFNWSGQIEHMSAPCPYRGPSMIGKLCQEVEPQRLARLDELWDLIATRNDNQEKRSEFLVPTTQKDNPSSENNSHLMGLYLEIKHQTWHTTRRNSDLLHILYKFLEERSILSPTMKLPFPVYIQSFEFTDLIRLRKMIGFEPNSNICLVGLGGPMRNLLNLPEDCCGKQTSSNTVSANITDNLLFLSTSKWPSAVPEMSISVPFYAKSRLSKSPFSKSTNNAEISRALRLITLKVTNSGHTRDFSDIYQNVSSIMESRRRTCTTPAPLETLVNSPDLTLMELKDKIDEEITAELASDGSNPVVDPSCFMDAIGLNLEFVQQNPHIIQEMTFNGIPVHLWTIRSQNSLETALKLGAKGVITDFAATDKAFIQKASVSSKGMK